MVNKVDRQMTFGIVAELRKTCIPVAQAVHGHQTIAGLLHLSTAEVFLSIGKAPANAGCVRIHHLPGVLSETRYVEKGLNWSRD